LKKIFNALSTFCRKHFTEKVSLYLMCETV